MEQSDNGDKSKDTSIDQNPDQIDQSIVEENLVKESDENDEINPSKKIKLNADNLVEKEDHSDSSQIQINAHEINPFLRTSIVEAIMSHMTIEDLKKARNMCSVWEIYATKELLKLKSQIKGQRFEFVKEIEKFETRLKEFRNKNFISDKITATVSAISTRSSSFYQKFKPESLTIEIESGDANLDLDLIRILQNSFEYLKELYVMGDGRHFDRNKIKWPENLKFPQLQKLSFQLEYCVSEKNDIYFFIKNIIEKAPNITTLKMFNQPIAHPICDLLNSCGLISKLNDFGIFYGDSELYGEAEGDDLVIANDLIKMAQSGLKLSKFTVHLQLWDQLEKDVILSIYEKLKDFLISQSDTLETLDISIRYALYFDLKDCKFDIPSLSKLKSFSICINERKHYQPINLPILFPNLQEISIKSDLDISELFIGSLNGVKKVSIFHSNRFSTPDHINYLNLFNHFPSVEEIEVDRYFNCNLLQWEKTLKKIIIHTTGVDNLTILGNLSKFESLTRLELIKDAYPWAKYDDFNIDLFSNDNLKSLKLQNYHIPQDQIEKIRIRYRLDYIPSKFKPATHLENYNDNDSE